MTDAISFADPPLTVSVNGAPISREQIEAWELWRARAVLRSLRGRFGTELLVDLATADLDELRAECLRIKTSIGSDSLREGLQGRLHFAALTSRLALWLSFGRRRQCITEIVFPGIDARAVATRVDALMRTDSAEVASVNLGSCPDHYVLQPQDGGLEVIETTGGSPTPIQMFIRFGDASGLVTEPNAGGPHESVGTARLKDGTIIGGVRHQFRDTAAGVHARLMVEFPATTPSWMIRQHQWHLACEWSRWFRYIGGL